MPYAFMLLAGFLMVWSQLGSTNLNNARERITHSQIDSAVSAVVYYGNYVKEVATYRRSDGTTPNKSLVQSTTGASNDVLDQVRANGNMPDYLSWFEGVNGLNGYLDSATGQLWVYFYVPASEIHPVDNPGGLLGKVTQQVMQKYGSQILAGQVRVTGGVKQVQPVVFRSSVYPDAVPAAIPDRAIVYRISLNLS